MSRVSTVHAGATLEPKKLEIISRWIHKQPWFRGHANDLRIVGNFRFEDPDGEVGLDSILVESEGDVYYVPLTWRSSTLPSWAELLGEAEHSELGNRFCYNAATDPVFVAEAERVIAEGDTQSEIHTTAGEVREPVVQVRGNGTPLREGGKLRVVRRLGTYYPGESKLVATWELDGVQREDVIAVFG